jgi:hypothetical protein
MFSMELLFYRLKCSVFRYRFFQSDWQASMGHSHGMKEKQIGINYCDGLLDS